MSVKRRVIASGCFCKPRAHRDHTARQQQLTAVQVEMQMDAALLDLATRRSDPPINQLSPIHSISHVLSTTKYVEAKKLFSEHNMIQLKNE